MPTPVPLYLIATRSPMKMVMNDDLAEWKPGVGHGCEVMQRSEGHIQIGQAQWKGQKRRNAISEESV